MTGTRINGELSDLFFNHQHAHRAAYSAATSPDDFDGEEADKALLEDAKEFVECYRNVIELFGNPTAEDLQQDFNLRV